MPTPQTTVHITRAFSGPRHSALEFLWECYAEYYATDLRLKVFNNPNGRLSHAACLEKMWQEALAEPERYAVLTEFDFLPYFGKFAPHQLLTAKEPVLAPEYVTRNPNTNKLTNFSFPGAWYIMADKDVVRSLDFSPGGSHNDPCNNLDLTLRAQYPGTKVQYLLQNDAMPDHYGTTMFTGQHLFWSRHYNDDPSTTVAGFHIGDILRRHDNAVERWLSGAPRGFRKLVEKRIACVS